MSDDQKSPSISYHFDLGNSTDGPIGMCARVTASSPEEALRLLQAALPLELSVSKNGQDTGVEYIEVYLNPDAISVADIDDFENEED